MIAWCRLCLLEAGFVLLVYYHHAQIVEWQKYTAPHSHYYVIWIVRYLLAVHLHPFGIGISAVVHAKTISKNLS